MRFQTLGAVVLEGPGEAADTGFAVGDAQMPQDGPPPWLCGAW